MRTLFIILSLLTIFILLSCKSETFIPEAMEAYRPEGIERAFLKPKRVSVTKEGDTYTLTGKGFPKTILTIKTQSSSKIFKEASWKNGSFSMKAAIDSLTIEASCKNGKGNEELIEEICNSIYSPVVVFDSLVIKEGELVDKDAAVTYYKTTLPLLQECMQKIRNFDYSFKVNAYNYRHTVDHEGKTVTSGHSSSLSYSGYNDSDFTKKVGAIFKDATFKSELDDCSYEVYFTFLN